MKEHEVIFSISLKGHDAVKNFRTMVPADDEIEAYEKAVRFAEAKTEVKIIAINETDFVIPIQEEENELDEVIRMGKIAEHFKRLEKLKQEVDAGRIEVLDIYREIIDLGNDLVWLGNEIKKMKES